MNGHAPRGFHTVTPFLIAERPRELMEFIVRGLGGIVMMPPDSDEHFHAEVRVGDSTLMLRRTTPPAYPAYKAELYLYVPDADALFKQAVAAGATQDEAPADRPWGDRMGAVRDCAGNRWMLATCKQDLRPAA